MSHILRFNNIAQKNLEIVGPSMLTYSYTAAFRPNSSTSITHHIDFSVLRSTNGLTRKGVVTVDLGSALHTRWVNGGKAGASIVEKTGSCHYDASGNCIHTHHTGNNQSVYTNANEIILTSPTSYISFSATNTDTFHILSTFQYNSGYGTVTADTIDIKGNEYSQASEKWLGTMRYEIQTPSCSTVSASKNRDACPNTSVTLTALPNDSTATYHWYLNSNGLLVGSTRSVTLTPTVTTTYEVEVIQTNGCIGYATIQVNYTSQCTRSLSNSDTDSTALNSFRLYPNPNDGNMTVEYDLKDGETGRLRIADISGRLLAEYKLDARLKSISLSQGSFENGTYFCSFIVNDRRRFVQKLLIVR